MTQGRLWISAAIIAVVIIVSFALSVPHTKEVPQATLRATKMAESTTVSVKDTYRKGVHTLSGTIVVPTACTSVSAGATLLGDESTSPSIALALTVPEDVGICLQVPTKMTFSTTLEAPADLPVTTTVNGIEAAVTLL